MEQKYNTFVNLFESKQRYKEMQPTDLGQAYCITHWTNK